MVVLAAAVMTELCVCDLVDADCSGKTGCTGTRLGGGLQRDRSHINQHRVP